MGPTQYRRRPGSGQCGNALKLRTHAVASIDRAGTAGGVNDQATEHSRGIGNAWRSLVVGTGAVGRGLGWLGIAVGAEPDPEAVRQLMEKYEREAAEEAAKKPPVPKPRPKPAPVPKPQPQPKSAPTVNYDHEAWKSAERRGTAACFEAYLEDYPKGRYARMARARLKSAAPPSKTPVVATPVPLEKSSPKSSDLNVVPMPKGCFI